ncbi:MAG: exo-alpha-sialidase [Cyclobacteriaceae bacterium]|nr:exo-alpha-sialidase [Cyclobacteriaceae bacterium]
MGIKLFRIPARELHAIAFLAFVLSGVLAAGTAAAQFSNVILTPPGESDYDPSIVINRKNPRNIVVAGSRHVYRSSDGGTTWETVALSPDVPNHGGVTVVSDRKGDLYLFHLSGESEERSDRIACQISKDNGATWSLQGVMTAADADIRNPSVTIDARSGEFLVQWTQYDKYGSDDESHHSRVMISESKDGKKWSTPLPISRQGDCRDGNTTPKGATVVISRDGYRVSTWSHEEKIYADRSFDKGRTWLSNDIEVEKQPGGSNPVIPGLAYGSGLPVLVMNHTSGRYAGTLNLFWADQRNGADDTDIWFSRSVNYGDNWTPATRINDDAKGKHQFAPAPAIDQSNGNIYVVYYDRRNFDDNQTEIFLAFSRDQGSTFTNVKISDNPFTPDSSLPSSGRIGIDVHNGVIVSAWTRYDEGATRIVFAVMRDSDLSAPKEVSASPE